MLTWLPLSVPIARKEMYHVQITNVTSEILDFTSTGGEAFLKISWVIVQLDAQILFNVFIYL